MHTHASLALGGSVRAYDGVRPLCGPDHIYGLVVHRIPHGPCFL